MRRCSVIALVTFWLDCLVVCCVFRFMSSVGNPNVKNQTSHPFGLPSPQDQDTHTCAKTDFTSSSWSCRPGRTMRKHREPPATFMCLAIFVNWDENPNPEFSSQNIHRQPNRLSERACSATSRHPQNVLVSRMQLKRHVSDRTGVRRRLHQEVKRRTSHILERKEPSANNCNGISPTIGPTHGVARYHQ